MSPDLRTALNGLPMLEEAALRMRFGLVKDRPYEHHKEEIAARLDVTVSQAHALIESGLHRLRLRAKKPK